MHTCLGEARSYSPPGSYSKQLAINSLCVAAVSLDGCGNDAGEVVVVVVVLVFVYIYFFINCMST